MRMEVSPPCRTTNTTTISEAATVATASPTTTANSNSTNSNTRAPLSTNSNRDVRNWVVFTALFSSCFIHFKGLGLRFLHSAFINHDNIASKMGFRKKHMFLSSSSGGLPLEHRRIGIRSIGSGSSIEPGMAFSI